MISRLLLIGLVLLSLVAGGALLYVVFGALGGGEPSAEPSIPLAEAVEDSAGTPVSDSTSTPNPGVPREITAEGDLVVDAPAEAPPGMVWVPGGTFQMGSNGKFPDEQPIHNVDLDGYWIDEVELTNAQFLEFADASGYRTVAEKTPRREDFVGQIEDINAIPAENLVPGSICFNPDFDRKTLTKDHPLWPYQVWSYVKGASWREPDGPGSSLEGRLNHPVVHVSWYDAVEYCKWAGKRLPTEAEWEYAARGKLAGKTYPWGNERNPEGKWLNNIWQGEFPYVNKNHDGFKTTSPVRTFPPNAYGLYDMSGNVWEWCSDFYRPDYYAQSPRRDPFGPKDSFDPNEPGLVKRVQRGGSFMCNDNYCIGYRVSARMKGTPDSGAFHTGFRCVLTPGMLADFQRAPAQLAEQQGG